MLKKRWDKSRLPSRHVTEGPGRAPHRSYYYAMGLTEDEINQPFVGVATCWNEAAPCNIALSRQAQSVKKGVAEAGGTPREFTTITVTDGIAMGHQGMKSSLVSREVIADSVELTVRGHCYDALVGLAGCDKSLPGMMMAMLRLNVPACSCMAAASCPASSAGKDVTVVDVFEAVGQHAAGNMSDEDLHELECVACPSAGACGGQFTANTMATVSEAIGLALPGSAGSPAPYEDRDRWAVESGPGGDGAGRERAAAARHRDAQGARERRRGGRRHRRQHQCRPASAGDGARGRASASPWTTWSRSCAARPTSPTSSPAANTSPTTSQGRRHPGDPEGAAGWRPAARRLHDRHRQDAGREPGGRRRSRPTRT